MLPLKQTRYALIVTFFCYLPHCMYAPWWLLLLFVLSVLYRLLADYYQIAVIPAGMKIILAVLLLVLLKKSYGTVFSSSYFIGFLLAFVALKILELQQLRDLKFLALCHFYLILSFLILVQELWIILYLFVTVVANFSLLLKITAPRASLAYTGLKCGQLLLLALPLSILLFYLFPRLANPLWQIPSLAQSHTGFGERLNPGAISELFLDDSTAMRVTFNSQPVLHGYWQGLVLSFYNGSSWNPGWYNTNTFNPVALLPLSEAGDYEVLLEPHQQKWLFYLDYPVAGRPNLKFSSYYGLISSSQELITQRYAYVLNYGKAPNEALSDQERKLNTQLPQLANPRLKRWSQEQYALAHYDINAFILFLQNYIHSQPFWYSLTPPTVGQDHHQMDEFWFTTQRGFCEHYASAVTLILRLLVFQHELWSDIMVVNGMRSLIICIFAKAMLMPGLNIGNLDLVGDVLTQLSLSLLIVLSSE